MQTKICDHLRGISQKMNNTNIEEIDIGAQDFIIGEEVYCKATPTSSRYFKIIFNEIRTDQEFVQITPMICTRNGYLKIDQNGCISLKDDKFNPYDSSCIFYFDQKEEKLKSDVNWEIAEEQRLSSRCIKGLSSLGLFAIAATVAYNVVNENIKYVI